MAKARYHHLERFMLFVEIPKQSGCWLWMAKKDRWGYGHFKFDGKDWLAHRYAYTILIADIPNSLTLDHLCRRQICVNPFHLEPVTSAENNRRRTGMKYKKVEGK